MTDFAECISVLANAKRFEKLVDNLRRRLTDVLEATAAAADHTGIERDALNTVAAHERIEQELDRRLAAALEKRRELEPRQQRLCELHAAWRTLNESDDVIRGLRAAEFTPLPSWLASPNRSKWRRRRLRVSLP
jgi:hypothetical protein